MLLLLWTIILFLEVEISKCLVPSAPENNTDVLFDPPDLLKSSADNFSDVQWFTTIPEAHHASYQVFDPVVSSVVSFNSTFGSPDDLGGNVTGRGHLNVSSDFIGYNHINVTIYDQYNNTLGIGSLRMSVTLSYQKLNNIFTYVLAVFIFIVYINMGATIDLEVVKQIVKKPIGPLVGIACQYGLMPVFAFGLAKLFFQDDVLLQLGLFINGASPGGGASNMWTLLLGGSLDLSIMMTFVSTIVAFGAVPLWTFTLGPVLIGESSSFVIPYSNIALIVASLVIPCTIGILIQKFLPKVAKFLEKRVLGPFSVFNIVFILTVGLYSNRYILKIFTWKILIAGFTLPVLGYLSGLSMGLLFRRSRRELIAISIETGVQNANIAMIILKFTLEKPASDLAVVMPVCGFLMTPIPLIIALIIKKVKLYFTNKGQKEISTAPPTPPKDGIENRTLFYISNPDMIIEGTTRVTSTQNSNGITENNGIRRTNNKKIKHNEERFGIDNPAADLEDGVMK